MDKIIAFCGLTCTECPAFLATQADDDDMRRKVAETWSKEFKADIPADSINCNGCLSTQGTLFQHCTVCEIRKCGLEHNIKNCAFCDDYVCDKLNDFFAMVPSARETLDTLHSSGLP